MKDKIFKIIKNIAEIILYALIAEMIIAACVIFLTPFVHWGLEHITLYTIILLIIGCLIKEYFRLRKKDIDKK